jgi:adenylosuccinate lyase
VILAEAIQTILRRENFKNPYETLKDLTRGKKSVTKQELHEFIASLDVEQSVKQELMDLSPFSYIGYASEF